ncbi:dihydropteroate synthase [Bacteroidia bacterium]|nr:dihydropteroate synthase [Bacteroidia bacterium]
MKISHSSIRCGEQVLSLEKPLVMGILNVTEDSFYAQSRCTSADSIAARTHQIVAQGGAVVDVGAYSTRPNAADVAADEEIERLTFALSIIRQKFPEVVVSIDTFRSEVVQAVVKKFGSVIVNDISGGELDAAMFATVAQLRLPYILMHSRGTPQTMQQLTHYDDLLGEITYYFSAKIRQLHSLGVADLIVDPGFGFAKTTAQNFELLARMNELHIFGLPLLAGLSRKSLIYKTLQCSPEEALNGTTALNTLALQQGASILRVHDVRAASQAITLHEQVSNYSPFTITQSVF